MLVQRWPLSTCQIVNASGHACGIPRQVEGWTIHGLWPSGYGSYPQYCHSWIFNMSAVMDLAIQLLTFWPNLYIHRPIDSLWKHEYEKHGTCSASLHGFETEHDYFEQGLALSHKHDVQRVLEQNDIFPREEGYKASVIRNAIQSGYNKTVCPGCGYVKGIGQVLSQSYVCIDKKMELIDCPDCQKVCVDDYPVLYQPLHF